MWGWPGKSMVLPSSLALPSPRSHRRREWAGTSNFRCRHDPEGSLCEDLIMGLMGLAMYREIRNEKHAVPGLGGQADLTTAVHTNNTKFRSYSPTDIIMPRCR